MEIRARLTPEQGAVVLKALEAAVELIKNAEPEIIENTSAEVHPANVHDHRRADALVLMANRSLENTASNANTADRFQVVVHVDSQVLSGEIESKPTGEPDCYIEKQVALPVESVRRLSCSCKIVTALTNGSEPLNIGRSTRAISTGIRRALAIRDGRCMFPGCDCNQYLDAHHIVHWSNGGETSLNNLIEVCHYHHVQLHEGGYSVQFRSCFKAIIRFKSVTKNPGMDAEMQWTMQWRCIVLIQRVGARSKLVNHHQPRCANHRHGTHQQSCREHYDGLRF